MYSSIIEVAIPLTFIFVLLSFVCSAAAEMIELFLKQRAANLERGIQELAGSNSQEFVSKLYNHGLITPLYVGMYAPVPKGFFRRWFQRYVHGPDLPSYIPSKNFALTLIDLKRRGAILPPSVKEALGAFELVAGSDVVLLQRYIEGWYNSAMDRVSGRYKRRCQLIILILGLTSAVVLNVDCIEVLKRLSVDASFSQVVQKLAESTISNTPVPNANQTSGATTQPDAAEQAINHLHDIQFELGVLDAIASPVSRDYSLKDPAQLWAATRLHWAGWLLTTLIVTLVAPCWFDVLNRIMNVRSTVKPFEGSWVEGPTEPRLAAPVVLPVEEKSPRPESTDDQEV